jgi:hypothetical protein
MNGAQQILTIASILLITVLIVNVQRSTGDKIITTYTNESFISGTSIAQSLIDEMSVKSFDEQTIEQPALEVENLTSTGFLGPDPGEDSRESFDDVDDYNKYEEVISNDRMGDFKIKILVSYVNRDELEKLSGGKTFIKNISVSVTNYNLPTSLVLSRVIGY